MRIEVAGHTHVGMKRNHNEDNYLLLPEQNAVLRRRRHGRPLVRRDRLEDRRGRAGRVLPDDRRATRTPPGRTRWTRRRNYDENRLATGIKLANLRIFERASSRAEVQGHGHHDRHRALHATARRTWATWATAACTSSAQGVLKQVTEDHSLLNDYLKAKKLTPEEIENFPHKNVIVRALGMKDAVQVDVAPRGAAGGRRLPALLGRAVAAW